MAEIRNYRQAAPDLATSGQPTEEQLAAIAAAGYELVINLALHDDPRYALPDERAAAEALGLAYVHIPVQFGNPTEADLRAFFAAMDENRTRRVWVHCAANLRVTAFVGLYRVLHLGWEPDQAFALMRELWQPDAIWSHFIAEQMNTLSFRAPWSRALRISSMLSAAILALVPVAAGSGMPHHVLNGLPWVVVVPLMLFVGAALFTIRGYQLGAGELRVRRLLWNSTVPLRGLVHAWHDPEAMRGSWRIFGNGGLFAFSGLFWSRSLGRYRAWATDPARAVVLALPGHTCVVTPEDPAVFLERLGRSYPHAVAPAHIG